MRCHGCHTTLIEIRSRTGSADKSACYGFITDEFTDEPKYWTTLRITYNFENGSWYYNETHPGGTIDTSEGCPDLETESDYDPEEDYGAPVGDPSNEYSGAVSLAGVFAAAVGGMVFGATSGISVIGTLSPSSWHNGTTSGAPISAAGSSGTRATVDVTQVQFRARGYLKLPVKLEFFDTEGTAYTFSLPSDGGWTEWKSITPQPDKSITIGPITAKMGKYA